MSAAAQPLNQLTEKIRGAHPGAYDDMDDAALTKAVLAKYPQYEDLAQPIQKKGPIPLPNGGDTGEGPIAQGLTTMETKLSEVPGAIGRNLITPNPMHMPGTTVHQMAEHMVPAAKAMNPIDTEEGSTAMNIGGTAANLIPYAIDPAGGGIGESAVGQAAKTIGRVGQGGVRLAARGTEAIANQKLAPIKPILKLGTPADEAGALHLKVPGRDLGIAKPKAPIYPGGNLPESPSSELTNARVIGKGASKPAPPQSAGLGKIPVAKAEETPAIPPPAAKGNVGELLNDSLGGKPLKPNVSLRNQMKPNLPTDSTSLPEGFTETKSSSALKGFKYSPESKEFEVVTKDGSRHVYGDVSSEQAQAFKDNPSSGKAWQDLRNSSSAKVAKVVNGERVSTIPPKSLRSASPTDENPNLPTGEDDDLVGKLKQSVKIAKASKR